MGLFTEPNAICLWQSAQKDRGAGVWEAELMHSAGLLVVVTTVFLAHVPGGIPFYK